MWVTTDNICFAPTSSLTASSKKRYQLWGNIHTVLLQFALDKHVKYINKYSPLSLFLCIYFIIVVKLVRSSLLFVSNRFRGTHRWMLFSCHLSVSSVFLLPSSTCLPFYIFLHAMSRRTPLEVRSEGVRLRAGNYGNPVLIGQWPGRMIGSCCQWGLFMQTGGRVGRPQMGPSDTTRRGTRRIYSPYFQFGLWNQFL